MRFANFCQTVAMDYFSYRFSRWLAVVLLLTGHKVRATGPTCFSCSRVSDHEDCSTLVECGDDEVCFAERRISGDLEESYTLGCEKTTVCQLVGGLSTAGLVGRKRNVRVHLDTGRPKRDVTVCSKCCRDRQCNQDVCVEKGLPASQDVYVRLTGGSNAYEGTVEVFYNGQWGSVCDDGWSGGDAAVVCRMLGYSPTGAGGLAGGAFPVSRGRIWLDEVKCTGTESSLAECDKSDWGIHDCTHQEDAAVLCSSVTPEDDVIFLLDTGLGGEVFRMNLMTQSYTSIPINRLYAPSSLDYDPEYGRIYFADPRLRQIVSVHFDGTDARQVRQLNMDAVLEKVEVDPLNRKLFYTDTGNNVIAVMNLNGTGYNVIVNSSLDEPRDIVLDPRNKKIYWSDWGTSPKIERANYDGSERTVLLDRELKWPNGMAIDYNDNRIYFVDGGTHRVEVMDLLGENRREIFFDPSAHFYSIAVFENYIYYTDWNHNALMRLNKDGSGSTSVGPPSFQELSDIRIQKYGHELPGVTTAAPLQFDPDHVFVRLNGDSVATSGYVEVYANGQWGTICDHGWDDRDAAVVCRMMGFSEKGALASNESISGHGSGLIVLDNVHCQGTERHLVDCGIQQDDWARHSCNHDEDAGVQCIVDDTVTDFLVFTDSYTGLLVRMDLNTYSFTGLQMAGAYNPVALAFNPIDRRLYFSEVKVNAGSQIYSIGLDASSPTLLKQMPQGSVVDGIAVDGNTQRLFYTDSGRDVIASMDLQGNNEQILISGEAGQPRAITLDPINRLIYWTGSGVGANIEKANYDGSNRTTIVSTNLKIPSGLVLDQRSGLLYFSDAGTHVIESVDASGRERTVIYSDLGAHFFGLAVTARHIYYSDWNRVSLMRLNKDGSGLTTAGPPSFTRINAIVTSESGN